MLRRGSPPRAPMGDTATACDLALRLIGTVFPISCGVSVVRLPPDRGPVAQSRDRPDVPETDRQPCAFTP